jgi:monovalent cation/hydrogen antiporter
MLQPFIQCIILIIVILLLVMLAQKLKVAYPIVLVLGGLLLSFYSGTRSIAIDPELIFVIFLPPLLYEAAWNTSWKQLWRWRRVVSSFAFLIVIVTSLVIALISSAILPGFTLALGFLLGGIISPPDAVSATSILKYVKVPRRLNAILEGESLLNDASSLIVFRFALIAVDTGRFVFHEAAFNFVVVVVMGIVVGVIIGVLYYAFHKWLPTTTNMDIVLSLTAPYVMYIVAESFHFSGVLAVVSGGLFLSVRSHLFLSHRSRLQGSNVWSTLGFVLNGLVFMLIGLQLPVITEQLGPVSLLSAIGYGLVITVILIVARILCTLGASVFTQFISKYITTADPHPGWRLPLVFGWAGMRGVVSLAAAMSIPVNMSNGAPFPQRNLILFITFVVILLTLVVQGLTLPLVVKWLRIPENDYDQPTAEQHHLIREKLASLSIQFIKEHRPDAPLSNEALQRLKAGYVGDLLPLNKTLTIVDETDQEICLELLQKQRLYLRELNKNPEMDEEAIRKFQDLLDVEEERLRLKFEQV